MPLFFPWPLLLVALALIAFLLRPVPAEETAKPVVPQTQVSDHLPLFCGIGILLSLLIGLSSTLDFVEYEEYYRNWHAISRLFLAAGYLAAGWLADHYPVWLPVAALLPVWLPVAALLAKVAVFAAYTFVLEGAPLWFTIFSDAFFSPFIILFIIWMFFNVALRSSRPELWAGMGRAIERPFHVLGALAGEMLLEQKVSHGVMSLVYMGLLILAVVLLYRLFLLYAEAWKHSVESEADARVKAKTASFANAGLNAAKNTKTLANAEISAQASADYFVETVEADNKKDTTATETITAVSADFFDNNQLEMVADETETSELFTTEITEEATAVKTISAMSADNSENQEEETAAEKEEAKQDDSQPDDSGPLHGDRLRKYQLRYRLTNWETEVLWEILQKHKIAEIASNLYITLPTAKYHISNILQKTGAQNQRELRYMIQKDES